MKIHRIWGIILRHLYATRRSLDRLTDLFYWPLVDLTLWGLTSTYFQKFAGGTNEVIVSIISGLILWLILWISTNSIALTILADLWDRNLMNVLVSPISFSEWMTGNILLALIKTILSLIFSIILATLLYKFPAFQSTLKFIPHILLLILTSWWVSFIILGTIMRFGTKIQTLAWAFVYILSPFSAVYYPLTTLPHIAQVVASFIPTSYVFESMREVLAYGTYDMKKLGISLILNIVYLAITLLYLKRSINRARLRGLGSLY